jgi:hypothetical protein
MFMYEPGAIIDPDAGIMPIIAPPSGTLPPLKKTGKGLPEMGWPLQSTLTV